MPGILWPSMDANSFTAMFLATQILMNNPRYCLKLLPACTGALVFRSKLQYTSSSIMPSGRLVTSPFGRANALGLLGMITSDL